MALSAGAGGDRAETGGGTTLAITMGTYLAEFTLDAGSGSIAGAFERFIAWTR